jgi:hypothetical protein
MRAYVDNPFQYNYVFSKEDCERQRLHLWQRIEILFLPTYVQISDGLVFYYKTYSGRYWITKIEALMKNRV